MQKELLSWYRKNRRELPWRQNRDPYRIWISEVMLQQTTVAAVIPYYEKFMGRFPSVGALARASEAEVLEMWAGLGYYSRARNLHQAARELATGGFPRTAAELLELPGFGPYTSRAVASLAFNEKVGVLDGNVIRILSRVHGLKTNWWLPKERNRLQLLADELAQSPHNSEINQGMMELGATVCTPRKPLCLLCPWKSSCVSLKKDLVETLPLPKPRAAGEIWLWEMDVRTRGGRIYLEKNQATPFLPGLLFPPGQALRLTKKPEGYDLKHSVTKYSIYIRLRPETPPRRGRNPQKLKKSPEADWFELESLRRVNPSSLMTKILKKLG